LESISEIKFKYVLTYLLTRSDFTKLLYLFLPIYFRRRNSHVPFFTCIFVGMEFTFFGLNLHTPNESIVFPKPGPLRIVERENYENKISETIPFRQWKFRTRTYYYCFRNKFVEISNVGIMSWIQYAVTAKSGPAKRLQSLERKNLELHIRKGFMIILLN